MSKRGFLKSTDGEFKLFSKITTIGRVDCNFIIKNDSVDDQHAVLKFDKIKECFVLEDLDTTHGSYVNKRRVQNESFQLRCGDILTFGLCSNQYKFHSSEEKKATTENRSRITDEYAQETTREIDNNFKEVNEYMKLMEHPERFEFEKELGKLSKKVIDLKELQKTYSKKAQVTGKKDQKSIDDAVKKHEELVKTTEYFKRKATECDTLLISGKDSFSQVKEMEDNFEKFEVTPDVEPLKKLILNKLRIRRNEYSAMDNNQKKKKSGFWSNLFKGLLKAIVIVVSIFAFGAFIMATDVGAEEIYRPHVYVGHCWCFDK